MISVMYDLNFKYNLGCKLISEWLYEIHEKSNVNQAAGRPVNSLSSAETSYPLQVHFGEPVKGFVGLLKANTVVGALRVTLT
jgi:hypothetical protein